MNDSVQLQMGFSKDISDIDFPYERVPYGSQRMINSGSVDTA